MDPMQKKAIWTQACQDAFRGLIGSKIAETLAAQRIPEGAVETTLQAGVRLAQAAANLAVNSADVLVAELDTREAAELATEQKAADGARKAELEAIKKHTYAHPRTPGVTWVFFSVEEGLILLRPSHMTYIERVGEHRNGVARSIHSATGHRITPLVGTNAFFPIHNGLINSGFYRTDDPRPTYEEVIAQHDAEAMAGAAAMAVESR